MLSNRYFHVLLNESKSKFRRLNNGLPQGSVLAPMLFNIYTHDIPSTMSQPFLYADDLALLIQCKSFQEAETILNEDLKVIISYYSSWRLKVNPSKSIVSVFHLNNREATRSPNVLLLMVLFLNMIHIQNT